MNHQNEFRKIKCGELIENFEKSNMVMKSPTIQEYNNLSSEIKTQYPKFLDYKKKVNENNQTTRLAMIDALKDTKRDYKTYTKGSDRDHTDFNTEADLLISKLGGK